VKLAEGVNYTEPAKRPKADSFGSDEDEWKINSKIKVEKLDDSDNEKP